MADQKDEKAASDGPATVRVAVAYPHDSFDPSVKGVPAITRDGVEVAKSHLKSVRDAAEASGVRLLVEG